MGTCWSLNFIPFLISDPATSCRGLRLIVVKCEVDLFMAHEFLPEPRGMTKIRKPLTAQAAIISGMKSMCDWSNHPKLWNQYLGGYYHPE